MLAGGPAGAEHGSNSLLGQRSPPPGAAKTASRRKVRSGRGRKVTERAQRPGKTKGMARQSAVPEQVNGAPGAKVVLDSVSPEGRPYHHRRDDDAPFRARRASGPPCMPGCSPGHEIGHAGSVATRASWFSAGMARDDAELRENARCVLSLEGESLEDATDLFAEAHRAVSSLVADYLQAHPDKAGRLHKSVVNRLLEEFAEVLTWSQLGLQHKPCGLLDVAGFYRALLAFLDHAVNERFIRTEHRDLVLSHTDRACLLDALAGWRPPAEVAKWVDCTSADRP